MGVLKALPREKGNPYVIAGRKPGTHLINLQKPWRAVREAAKLDDVRLHDLRHSFASFAVGAGLSLPVIGGLLGHKSVQTTARYAHLTQNPLRQATDMVGAILTTTSNPQKNKEETETQRAAS